jgi:hypothetical protein
MIGEVRVELYFSCSNEQINNRTISRQLNSTQHFFITQTGTAIDLKGQKQLQLTKRREMSRDCIVHVLAHCSGVGDVRRGSE